MTEERGVDPRPRNASEKRRASRKRRIVIWSCVLSAALLVGVMAKPTYHWLKSRRAHQLAAEGDTLNRNGKLHEAAAKFRAALQLDPLGYHPLQSAARLASKVGRPEAIDLWEQVVRRSEATAQDRQEYVALLIQNGRMPAAEKMLAELLQTTPDARTLSLAALFSNRTGNETKAVEFARAAAARAPDDNAARFQLAELLAASSDAKNRAEAREILWSLAAKTGDTQKAAIEALARAPELSLEEQERALSLFHLIPPTVIDGLLASDLELKLHPEEAASIYESATARWNQDEDMVELARWLNLHRQAARVLALVPLDRALAHEPLLLALLDALATNENWTEIDSILARTDLSLDPSVTESFRARTAQGRGASLDADLHWNRALSLANNDPAKLRFIATFAEQSRASTAAIRAYDQLARFPEQAAFAYRGSQRLSEQNGDALAARAAAEKVLSLSPDDPNAQAQVVYLNLLLSVAVEANLAKAKALAAKYPNRLSFRVAAALGFLRQHEAGPALAQFNGPAIDWARTPPAWRAVYGAVLAANKDAGGAKKIIETIPSDRLNKEERALIAPP